MDPGSVSQGVQGCPSPGMAERGEGNGGCNRGDGLPPGTGNGGCNRSDGLPPVPRTPSQQGSGSGMDGQTPETSNMPQQQPQQQQANVSQNVQGFASTTNLDASGQGYPVQGCQQGNMPVMQGQGPAWFGAQWIPQQQHVYATEFASVCTKFWLCEYAWWTKVWKFSKLRSERNELPRKHAEWPGWSELGRFDASGGADPRGHGHVR